MTKAPTPTEMSKGQSDNTNKSSIKKFIVVTLGTSVHILQEYVSKGITHSVLYDDLI